MKALELKYQVCDWAKRAYQDGLFEGTCGNLSAFDRTQGIVVITPSGVAYDRYRPEDMVVIDLEGRVLEGNYPPSSEWIMHTMVYRQKPEVNAVIHTHSPYASAFAVRNEGIPAILIEMIPTLGGDVPLAQFGMPGTEEVGAEAVKVLQGRGGCLLANHGVLAEGDTLEQACVRAGYVENAAMICAIAQSSGTIVPLGEERCRAVRAHYGVTI